MANIKEALLFLKNHIQKNTDNIELIQNSIEHLENSISKLQNIDNSVKVIDDEPNKEEILRSIEKTQQLTTNLTTQISTIETQLDSIDKRIRSLETSKNKRNKKETVPDIKPTSTKPNGLEIFIETNNNNAEDLVSDVLSNINTVNENENENENEN